jgi:hypothetical protein
MTVPKVYAAIHAVMAELAKIGIPKSQRNEKQNYNFRGIDDVLGALAPLLVQHNLLIIPQGNSHTLQECTSAEGKITFRSAVTLNYKFVSVDDGSTDFAQVFGEGLDWGDKATNKAHSAAYKLMAIQTFCIPTGEPDQDSETQNHEIKNTKPATKSNPSNPAPFPPCPSCGKVEAAIKNQYGDSDYACYRKRGGCGVKFNKDGSTVEQTT